MHLNVFFNTKISHQGLLAWIGDKGLAPFRYLFNGNNVKIDYDQNSGQPVNLHRLPSFPRKNFNSKVERLERAIKNHSKHSFNRSWYFSLSI